MSEFSEQSASKSGQSKFEDLTSPDAFCSDIEKVGIKYSGKLLVGHNVRLVTPSCKQLRDAIQ
jgi:hypothetical protein